MLRRLHKDQPASFEFTPANLEWARGQITKYPAGRQASAVIPLLWRAQEQHGWLTRPAIEYVADMLGMAYIRVLEVATFYFMFQLQPVGSVAHIQICGTTSCMICGAEELIAVCKELIAPAAHAVSADGKFSWEEVECMGACANAPMAQIGKDYYEDLTPAKLRDLIARFSRGEVPVPGPQNGRYAAEPLSGLTSLKDFESGRQQYNASAQRAVDIGDTVKRIDGTEVPILMPWLGKAAAVKPVAQTTPAPAAAGISATVAEALTTGTPEVKVDAPAGVAVAAPAQTVASGNEAEAVKPAGLSAARNGTPDTLQVIEGIGPKLEALCHELGFFHFDQIASWGPAEIAWMDANLKGFKGRVTRDKWVAQARIIIEHGLEEFQRRAKTNDY
ncbi:NADH-quinone oxidoreductase subunit E [Gemmobacter fulvus]|uniref:NADH-quinone oxidoreductase subunit E n=1 Tax=Gemmobacter fulvus TaxID=2840474 RepID=A0A975P7N3_9RHOB|nr:NADH-quinone oxidoreductase subunit E [Gemmobacter fulvus]MBT9243986.1 NADH-quinone oxidoreductase subunit E [Gemmobacter fulvus]QWK90897.1 NADH-quinone oxidoreductase subunit E [Gemmobacter fulvus]